MKVTAQRPLTPHSNTVDVCTIEPRLRLARWYPRATLGSPVTPSRARPLSQMQPCTNTCRVVHKHTHARHKHSQLELRQEVDQVLLSRWPVWARDRVSNQRPVKFICSTCQRAKKLGICEMTRQPPTTASPTAESCTALSLRQRSLLCASLYPSASCSAARGPLQKGRVPSWRTADRDPARRHKSAAWRMPVYAPAPVG